MRYVLLLSVVLCLIQFSNQRPKLVGDCRNFIKMIESFRDTCYQLLCNLTPPARLVCGERSRNCGAKKFVGWQSDDEKEYPHCCPRTICV